MLHIEIKTSLIDGKGVFALNDLQPGTLLPCDIITINKNNIDQNLVKYVYPYSKAKNLVSICLGFGSFFNSSELPNTKIKKLDKKNLILWFEIIKLVKKGEELFLKYKW
jgi:hypothetical protein